ncbi:MAG: DUF3164 family protein [Bacteroidia bacterium]|nr:DUF3164 family protein [Bacteroidia bacterium]
METKTLPVDLSQLTPAQIEELVQQAKEIEKAKKQAIKAERETYKQIVNDTVMQSFKPLVGLSKHILNVKKLVFDNFESVVEMKNEIYGIKESQQSHSFASLDGSITIKIGHRVTESFDDTLTAGIEKVKTYMATLAKDQESAALVETIMDLLKKDAKGNLKANRVLELTKLASRVNNEDFSDGIRIIQEAYKPVKSCNFIEVKFKDDHGKEHSLPLSISAFGLEDEPEKETEK